MNKKLKKLAAMMMALMMIALVGITASAQTEETEQHLFFGAGRDMIHRYYGFEPLEEDVAQAADTADEEQLRVRIVPHHTLKKDGDQDEEQGVRDFFRKVKSGFSKVGHGIKNVLYRIADPFPARSAPPRPYWWATPENGYGYPDRTPQRPWEIQRRK